MSSPRVGNPNYLSCGKCYWYTHDMNDLIGSPTLVSVAACDKHLGSDGRAVARTEASAAFAAAEGKGQ